MSKTFCDFKDFGICFNQKSTFINNFNKKIPKKYLNLTGLLFAKIIL